MRHGLVLAALWTVTLLAYSDSFRGGLIFDASKAILDDSRIQAASAENSRLIWTNDYWYGASTGLFRPLTTFSYLFNYAVLGNGPRPAGYHWINFALHAINLALVYLLALAIFRELAPAVALAALWALHPVLTESVTNVVGRADLLAAFGVLAGVLCYARGSMATGRGRLWWPLALAVAAAIGSFSKESGVVLVAAVLLYDLAFARNRPWSARIPGYLAAAVPVLVYLQIRGRILAALPTPIIAFVDNPLVGADFWTARLTSVKVIGKYLWLLIWPGQLAADYSYRQIPLFGWRLDNGEDWQTILALAAVAVAAVVALRCYRRAPAVSFFIAFFFVTLAPTANLVILIGAIMAERFLYLPSVGFLGCQVWLAWSAYRLGSRRPAARFAAAAALLFVAAALGSRTFARNLDWRDELSLWSSAERASPQSYKTHINLAQALMNLPGSAPERIQAQIEQALAILDSLPDERNVPTAYTTAGLWFRANGDRLEQSLRTQAGYTPPGNPWYQKSLKVFLRGESIDHTWRRMAIERSRADGKTAAGLGWAPLYLGLGRLYEKLGQPSQALEALRQGLQGKIKPEFFEEMSASYRALGEPDQAAIALMEGVAIDPAQPRLASEVVQLYRDIAPLSCAVTDTSGAVSLNLGCPLVRGHLCAASRNVAALYREDHRAHEAAAVARSAIASFGCRPEIFQ